MGRVSNTTQMTMGRVADNSKSKPTVENPEVGSIVVLMEYADSLFH
jgi:hypothetical protein